MTSVWVTAALSIWLTQAPPKSIASPTWKTVQVKPELAEFYADIVGKKLRDRGFTVVRPAEIEALLTAESQKQLMGCSDDSTNCMAELAAALGCDATLLGNLAQLDDTYRGNLKILSSVNGKVLAEVQVSATGQNALATELEAAAERLADGLAPTTVRAASGTKRRLWPGPAIGGAALVVAGLVCFGVSESTYASLDAQLRSGRPIQEGDARTGALVQTLGWVGLGVGAAALATAGVLALLTGNDVKPTVALGPDGAVFGLVGVFP